MTAELYFEQPDIADELLRSLDSNIVGSIVAAVLLLLFIYIAFFSGKDGWR